MGADVHWQRCQRKHMALCLNIAQHGQNIVDSCTYKLKHSRCDERLVCCIEQGAAKCRCEYRCRVNKLLPDISYVNANLADGVNCGDLAAILGKIANDSGYNISMIESILNLLKILASSVKLFLCEAQFTQIKKAGCMSTEAGKNRFHV